MFADHPLEAQVCSRVWLPPPPVAALTRVVLHTHRALRLHVQTETKKEEKPERNNYTQQQQVLHRVVTPRAPKTQQGCLRSSETVVTPLAKNHDAVAPGVSTPKQATHVFA